MFPLRKESVLVLAVLGLALAGPAQAAPPWLPTYLVSLNLDVAGHEAHASERVTWIWKTTCIALYQELAVSSGSP